MTKLNLDIDRLAGDARHNKFEDSRGVWNRYAPMMRTYDAMKAHYENTKPLQQMRNRTPADIEYKPLLKRRMRDPAMRMCEDGRILVYGWEPNHKWGAAHNPMATYHPDGTISMDLSDWRWGLAVKMMSELFATTVMFFQGRHVIAAQAATPEGVIADWFDMPTITRLSYSDGDKYMTLRDPVPSTHKAVNRKGAKALRAPYQEFIKTCEIRKKLLGNNEISARTLIDWLVSDDDWLSGVDEERLLDSSTYHNAPLLPWVVSGNIDRAYAVLVVKNTTDYWRYYNTTAGSNIGYPAPAMYAVRESINKELMNQDPATYFTESVVWGRALRNQAYRDIS